MDRREALGFLAGTWSCLALPAGARPAPPAILSRAVPSSGEQVPVVGLGTWITFDVNDAAARRSRGEILGAFLAAGGRMVDSSPMYGAAEDVVGEQAARLGAHAMFSATKVWTLGALAGRRQMENSFRLWRARRIDLMQVHNLLDWRAHWPTLRAWKSGGRLRYVGITTSHGRRHGEVVDIMRRERPDFVQVSYSMADRSVEREVLAVAAERGVAVIANRPFDGGAMFGAKTAGPLPGWAREIGCRTWAEAFLKWIVAHPAVTCAIPATSRLPHLRENVRALSGELPDTALRRRMLRDYERT